MIIPKVNMIKSTVFGKFVFVGYLIFLLRNSNDIFRVLLFATTHFSTQCYDFERILMLIFIFEDFLFTSSFAENYFFLLDLDDFVFLFI